MLKNCTAEQKIRQSATWKAKQCYRYFLQILTSPRYLLK